MISEQFQVHLTPEDVASGEGIDEKHNRAHGLYETWDDPQRKYRTTATGRTVPNTTVRVGTPVGRGELPDTLYHVTTDLPGIRDSGVIRSSGGGGLGGAHRNVVSMTTDPDIAHQLEQDVRDFATVASSRSPEGAMDWYHRKYEEHGLDGFDSLQRMYDQHFSGGGGDFGSFAANAAAHYHNARQRVTGARHPVILADLHKPDSPWWDVHPDRVGTVSVPTAALPERALVTDFDRSSTHGLSEVRVHADVPVHPALGAQFRGA
jgi:hypothetical protein